jgi:hypothetical protein
VPLDFHATTAVGCFILLVCAYVFCFVAHLSLPKMHSFVHALIDVHRYGVVFIVNKQLCP